MTRPSGEGARPGLPTTGPHVFVPVFGEQAELALPDDEAHHLATVLRIGVGDPVSLADGSGAVWQATVATVARRAVIVAVGERFDIPPPAVALTLVQCLPKGRKLDDAIRPLTELGVDRLTPVASSHSDVRLKGDAAEKVHRRWQQVAVAAAQQSRRPTVMAIDPPGPWPGPIQAPGIVLWERATRPFSEVYATLGTPGPGTTFTLVVGPEGGLSEEEVAATGLPAAALGPTILRTETAAVVGAALALHHLGRLG